MQLLNQNEEINKMDELKKHIYDENNGLHYTLVGDYYVPDLKLLEENRPIGHYGRLHREYPLLCNNFFVKSIPCMLLGTIF